MGSKERRAREREKRRSQILNAARSLLFCKGMEATSINQIARQAELGTASIYSYFENREAIFVALEAEGLQLLYLTMNWAAQEPGTAAQRLERMAMAYLQFSLEHRDYFSIINHFLTSPVAGISPNFATDPEGLGNRIITLFVTALTEGVAAGVFRDVDPRRTAVTFWSTLHSLILFEKISNTPLMGEDYKDLYTYAAKNMIQGLCR